MSQIESTKSVGGGGGSGGGGSGKVFTGFLVLATVALGVLCALLAKENRELKARMARGAGVGLVRGEGPGREPVQVGDRLGELTLVRRDGTVRLLGFSPEGGDVEEGSGGAQGGPALVFVMAQGCGYCGEVLPVWERVLTELGVVGEEGGGYVRVAAVQTDAKGPADVREFSPAIPVYMAPEPRSTWLMRVPLEPSVLLLDASGTVVKTWMGLPAAADAKDLRAAVLNAATGGGR